MMRLRNPSSSSISASIPCSQSCWYRATLTKVPFLPDGTPSDIQAANGTEALSLGLRSNQLKQPSPNDMGWVDQSGFQPVCAADEHATWW